MMYGVPRHRDDIHHRPHCKQFVAVCELTPPRQNCETILTGEVSHADPPKAFRLLVDLAKICHSLPHANFGGETGIRTLGPRKGSHAFEACAFGHSAISPEIERSEISSRACSNICLCLHQASVLRILARQIAKQSGRCLGCEELRFVKSIMHHYPVSQASTG